ncbi:THUMP domain-containing protein 1 [Quillaja saponaria]|uniref:THUMP domain-containing protein 1 n=1 Tax=Quillaja saponaria TaxID=32244 RepID=A0AAD7LTN6_QUISA|nr:THUMP domain-containing protein 1 [Quillaja saponaria]
MNIVDSSYEELLHGEDSGFNHKELSNNPLNTKIKFLSDSFSSGDDDKEEEGEEAKEEKNHKSDTSKDASTNHDDTIGGISDLHKIDDVQSHNLTEEKPNENKGKVENHENEEKEAHNPPAKKQCLKIDATKCDFNEEENKSIDKLIEAELKELGDKNKSSCTVGDLFILRVLPIEVSCYASEDDISKAIKDLVEKYFPVETQNPQKTVC